MDIMSTIAFSEDPGFLESQYDIESTLAGATKRFRHWHFWSTMPSLEKLLYKNKLQQKLVSPSGLGKIAVRKVQDRQKDPGSQQDLLSMYLAAIEQTPEWFQKKDVIGLTISTIHAGAGKAVPISLISNYLLPCSL